MSSNEMTEAVLHAVIHDRGPALLVFAGLTMGARDSAKGPSLSKVGA